MHAPIRLPAPVISAHWPSKAKEDLLDEFTFSVACILGGSYLR